MVLSNLALVTFKSLIFIVSTASSAKSPTTIVASSISAVVTASVAISAATMLSLKANFEYTIPAVALTSASTIVASSISVVVTAPAAIVTLVFCVFTANNAKGTAVKGALLISIKFEQLSSVLNSIFKFLANKLHWMSSKEAA